MGLIVAGLYNIVGRSSFRESMHSEYEYGAYTENKTNRHCVKLAEQPAAYVESRVISETPDPGVMVSGDNVDARIYYQVHDALVASCLTSCNSHLSLLRLTHAAELLLLRLKRPAGSRSPAYRRHLEHTTQHRRTKSQRQTFNLSLIHI